MGELSISSQKLKGRQLDSYLFWLRVKNILCVSFLVTIVVVFLSMTMFYRFKKIENKSLETTEKSQVDILLEEYQKN